MTNVQVSTETLKPHRETEGFRLGDIQVRLDEINRFATPTSPFCITLGPIYIEAVIDLCHPIRYHTLHPAGNIKQASSTMPVFRRRTLSHAGPPTRTEEKSATLQSGTLQSEKRKEKREKEKWTEKSSGNGRGRDLHASVLTQQARSRLCRDRTGHCTRAGMRQARGHYPLCWEHG